jgi:hypothetical protein
MLYDFPLMDCPAGGQMQLGFTSIADLRDGRPCKFRGGKGRLHGRSSKRNVLDA